LVTSKTENLAGHHSSNKAEKDNVTRQVLSQLNSVYESVYGHSFTQGVVELLHSGLQKKPTNAEKKSTNGKFIMNAETPWLNNSEN